MKKLNKILFVVIAGLFAAGVASASLGEYWSTVSHIIPRTNDTVDLGSTAKRVRTLFVNNLTCTDCVDDTNIDWGTGANQVSSADIPDHNSHTVRDTFVDIINRGKSEAITITLTGGLGVSWTTGELYDGNTNTFFSTDAGSGNVTNNAVNYLKWVSGTTLTLSTTATSGDEILIATGSVYDGNINCYRETSLINETVGNTRRGLRALFPTRVISGMSVHEDTDVTNPLDVTMDAGVFYKDAIEEKTPIEIKSRNTAMIRNFHTSGVWDSDTNAQIETTNYDNGTDLTAIPAGKYVKGLFILMCDNIGFVYPVEYFNTVAQAQDAALPTIPPGLATVPKLTAIVYQQGDTDFSTAIWQDVRAGISEESFSGVTDHGALAGLADDDHLQYTLADGTRAFTGTQTFNENIEMKDDKNLYFDTAKSKYIGYSTDHAEVVFNGENLVFPGDMFFYSNTGADGSGNWEPFFAFYNTGSIGLENTSQGSAGNKFFEIVMTDGMRLRTGGATKDAIVLADNIATSNKTFQFPNASGTFIIGEGVGAGQTLIGGTTTTSDLNLQTTSGVGTTGADMHFLVGNNGATEAMTILNNGRVGIGTNAPVAKLNIDQSSESVDLTVLWLKASDNNDTQPVFKVQTSDTGAQKGFQLQNISDASGWASFEFNAGGTGKPGLALGPGSAGRDTNIYRNAANVLRTSDSLIVDGNIGVGTVSPDTPLHIYDSSATTDLYIESGGSGLGGRIILEDTDGAGCTAITTLNGVLTAAIITCP